MPIFGIIVKIPFLHKLYYIISFFVQQYIKTCEFKCFIQRKIFNIYLGI